jgi:hypothetical protein
MSGETAQSRKISPGAATCAIVRLWISSPEEATVRSMLIALLVAACGVATTADAQTRRQNYSVTWGKAGVSLDEYRADSIACASEAYYLDVSNTTAAQRLVAASRQLQTIEDTRPRPTRMDEAIGYGADIGNTINHYRPDRQFEAIEEIQQQSLDSCLIHRGYHQFRLTESQQQHLRRLDRGSDQRRLYLHSLATDAEVLRQQSL